MGQQLSPQTKETLDSDITLTELTKSLSKMSNNKGPGLDGLIVEFC